MDKLVSVIIPNYNGSGTIGKCLEAVFSSGYKNLEVIVVDDSSTDNSVEIIKRFPCKFVQLTRRSGASKARNAGAKQSNGDILFFTDADCMLQEDTLAEAVKSLAGHENAVVGGTYTEIPFDDGFFSAFQSIFVNYSETKGSEPDYIATHAMAIERGLFIGSGGFPEDFLPILEDVELSHRLHRSGYKLIMSPDILVQHIFNFTLMKSLRNAFRKSLFWTRYSIKNRDLLADSGTASRELKTDVASFFAGAFTLLFFLLSGKGILLSLLVFIILLNLWSSRRLIVAFYEAKGLPFAFGATIYYMMLYPLAVGAGAFAGAARYVLSEAGK